MHVSNCVNKAIVKLKLLYNCRHVLSTRLIARQYDSLVLFIFNYCDVDESCVTDAAVRRIQTIQNCCLRYIYGIRKRKYVSSKLKQIGWLDMKCRRFLHRPGYYHGKIIRIPTYLYKRIHFELMYTRSS